MMMQQNRDLHHHRHYHYHLRLMLSMLPFLLHRPIDLFIITVRTSSDVHAAAKHERVVR
jgi:hypothetical protein